MSSGSENDDHEWVALERYFYDDEDLPEDVASAVDPLVDEDDRMTHYQALLERLKGHSKDVIRFVYGQLPGFEECEDREERRTRLYRSWTVYVQGCIARDPDLWRIHLVDLHSPFVTTEEYISRWW